MLGTYQTSLCSPRYEQQFFTGMGYSAMAAGLQYGLRSVIQVTFFSPGFFVFAFLGVLSATRNTTDYSQCAAPSVKEGQ